MSRKARGVITLTDIEDGLKGARSVTRYLYKGTESDIAPDAPSATLTWSTGNLSEITTGWSEDVPTVDATGSSRPWVSVLTFYQASSTSQDDTTTVTGSSPSKGFTFDGIVTFSNSSLTDGTTTYDPAGVINNSTTTIDGSKITTGTIDVGTINATSGTFDVANIPNLNADKITAGTISTDRLSIDGVTLDTNASGELIINDSGVNTTQIASNAVTIPVSSYTSGTLTPSGGSEATIQQVTITSTGEPIFINFTCICTSTAVFGQSSTNLKLYRGTTEVQDFGQMAKMEYGNALPLAISITDTPTAGTHTYYIKASTFISVNYKSRSMTALEVKR
jgi:hypothetical protein